MDIMKKLIIVGIFYSLSGCSDSSNLGSAEYALVYDTREILQCGQILSLEDSAQILVDAGIDVLSSSCGNKTGIAYAQVCGAPSASIIIHEIRNQNLPGAEAEGFLDVETLIDTNAGTSYEIVEC